MLSYLVGLKSILGFNKKLYPLSVFHSFVSGMHILYVGGLENLTGGMYHLYLRTLLYRHFGSYVYGHIQGQSHRCRYIAHLAQSADIFNKYAYLLVGFPTWELAFLSISFGGFFKVGISMSNEDKVRTYWLRSADI